MEEVGLCEGGRLVELIMTTLRNTCSLLLLSPNTDIKNGETGPCSLSPSDDLIIAVSHFVSLLSLCLGRQCYQPHHKQLLLSWKHKLVSIWGSGINLHHHQPGAHKKGKYQEERAGKMGSRLVEPINSFPISHWSDLEAERGRGPKARPAAQLADSQERTMRSETGASRKRFSLQTEVIIYAELVRSAIYPLLQSDGPDLTFHHRYSLPILEPSKGSNIVSINLDNYWDSSKFLLESKDPGDEYLAGRSPPAQYNSVAGSHGLELASDADLDSRLEVLCLSVTQNALE